MNWNGLDLSGQKFQMSLSCFQYSFYNVQIKIWMNYVAYLKFKFKAFIY